jgi:hypothetical protein
MPLIWSGKCDNEDSDRQKILKSNTLSRYERKRENFKHMFHAMHNSCCILPTHAPSFDSEQFYFQRDASFLK